MEHLNKILEFITANQHLIMLWSVLAFYALHRIINALASREQEDIWDSVKPYSDALYKLVHQGIEYYTVANPMSSVAKAQTFLLKISEFEKAWKQDKTKAIKELAAWYLSMKQKVEQKPLGEQLTADTVATES
jgi:hypothetical protein